MMRDTTSQPSRKTLSKDLTQSLIFTVSFIFLVTSVLGFWLYSYESKKTYLNKHSEYLSYLSGNLELPLWNIDRDWIKSICSSFSKNEIVSLLKVTSDEGELLFEMVNEQEPSLIVRTASVSHNDTVVGTVELGFTKRLYQKSNFQLLFRSMLPMLFVIVGLMIANTLIFSRLVEKPLNFLISRIGDISAGNYHEQDNTFDHLEIVQILDKFNHMANRVKERELSLRETNKKLEIEIIDRLEAEKAHIESEKRYQQLVEELPVGMFRTSAEYDGGYLMVNPAFVKMLGCQSEEEFLHMPVKQIYKDPDMREIVLEMLFREGTIKGLELEFKKKNGHSLSALITAHVVTDGAGQPLYVDGIIEDVSERNRLERQIRQTQKMEAIGTLAGGIAHDFNNILASIFGFTEAAKLRYASGQNVEKYFDEILNAGLRARSLIKQMLTFSRQTEVQREAISIGPIIKETIIFLRASLPAMIEIKRDFKVHDSTVWADPIHIHQILMNLCTNSAHAMKEGGGLLEIGLDEIIVQDAENRQFVDLSPGTYVKISVTDNGHGIPPEIIDRIFEPFFTTKNRVEGTGMGLAVIHGLVSDMHGTIIVESEPGAGSGFHVLLPKYDGGPNGQGMPGLSPKAGSEIILLVDDEEGFLVAGKEILERLGYTVVTAARGMDAFELVEKNPDKFDLVITDMAMPKMTGLELAKKILEVRKDMPIVLCTGFGDTMTLDLKKHTGFRDVVMKPILARELTEAIQGALGKNASRGSCGKNSYNR